MSSFGNSTCSQLKPSQDAMVYHILGHRFYGQFVVHMTAHTTHRGCSMLWDVRMIMYGALEIMGDEVAVVCVGFC